MRVWRVFVGFIGGLAAIVAFGLVVGGGVLAWAYGTQRDADGFLDSPDYEMSAPGYAILSSGVDLGAHPGDWFPSNAATVRVTASGDQPLFVGIGPASNVDVYLEGVARDYLDHLGITSTKVTYRHENGDAPGSVPGDQTFWVASSQGTDAAVEWDVTGGSWAVVVMNADGSSGITATVEGFVRIDLLLGIAIGLIVGGLVFGVLGALALVWATRRRPSAAEAAALPAGAAPSVGGPYPLAVSATLDAPSRGLWLVKWLLLIPHFVVLAFLWAAAALLTIVAFFSIVFTGRYPRGIFDFNVGVMRWSWRVGYYSYSALGTDKYPPFTLQDADYPARLDVAYPERLSRGLVWVKWLLAIPHLIIVGFLTSGLVWWTVDMGGKGALRYGGGLIGILVLIAGVALLFTGRYPGGLYDLVMGLNRWAFRVGAYVALLTDEYPPFRLDSGGSEPAPSEHPQEVGSGG